MQHWREELAEWVRRLGAENRRESQPTREYQCPQCQDRGVVVRGEVAVPCPCRRQLARRRRFRLAGLEGAFASCSFARFELRFYPDVKPEEEGRGLTYREVALRTLRAAEAFTRQCAGGGRPRGLFITGPVGSGKTFLAGAVANALLESGRDVLAVVVPDLLDELRASYGEEAGPSERELMHGVRSAEVLILDDLGAHPYTAWTAGRLYSIINHRLNNWLPTVITSNLELEELESYLGERTTSRIVQLCDVYRLDVPEDIRCRLNREGRASTPSPARI